MRPINYWDGDGGEAASSSAHDRSARPIERDLGGAAIGQPWDMERANAECRSSRSDEPGPVQPRSSSRPRIVFRATQSGTWGDARESTPEFGERYLSVVTEATVRMLDDLERTFAAMPPR